MKRFSLLFAAALTTSIFAQAETIQISVSKQAPNLQTIERPSNGMKKEDVENLFGAPQEVDGPTGEPPISMWVYKNFSVYFENDTVLHSVLHQESTLN